MQSEVEQMATHISQIYSCSTVELPCELYYMVELGKYLKYYHDEELSLKGVIFTEGLEKTKIWQYFKIAIANGWIVETGLSSDLTDITYNNELTITSKDIINLLLTTEKQSFDAVEHEKRRDADYALRTPKKTFVSFAKQSELGLFWKLGGEENQYVIENGKIINEIPEQGVLSLLAFVAIKRLKADGDFKLLLEFGFQSLVLPTTLAYYMLLTEYTNALQGWVNLYISEEVSPEALLQLDYSAWYMKGKDMGELSREYSIVEKKAHAKKLGIEVGDIALMYKRKPLQRYNYLKEIESCRVCQIKAIDGRNMKVEYINNVKTMAQAKFDFDGHPDSVKKMYCDLPYLKLNTTTTDIDMGNLGVGYYLFTEEYLLLPLSEAGDHKVQHVDMDNEEVKLILEQNDLIYWILSDYNYQYDAERFLRKNFKELPLYDKYHKGEYIEPENFATEQEC